MSIILATRGIYRPPVPPTPPAPEGPEPTVHLRFTETSGTSAVDAEGVQNGVYVSSPDLGLPVMEAGGGGFGVKDGQHVSVAHNAAFAVPGGWGLHFKFMISKALTVSGDRYGLMSKASLGANECSVDIRFDGTDHKIRAFTTTDASVARFIPPTGGNLGVGPALVVGTAYRCSLVQRPTGASLYLNSAELGSNDVLDGLDNNTAVWGIGCYLHPTQGALIPFNGCIAGWRFFNVPPSGVEVAAIPAAQDTIWLRDIAATIDAGIGRTLNLASHAHPENITAVAGDDDAGGVVVHDTPISSSLVLDTTEVTGNTSAEITAQVTKGALTSREATIDLTVLPSGAFALHPVTIQGDRFYSGGQPYFPITHFLWESATSNFSHIYWSHEISADAKLTIADTIKNASEGFNCIYLYTLNENDYGGLSVSPYDGNGVAFTTFNDAKLASMRTDAINFINDGIRPIIWLRADDSPTVNSYSAANFKSYMQRMVNEFDDLPIMWVLGLEVNEYWSVAEINDFGAHLASIATQPVGVHLLSGTLDIMDETWVQFVMAQNPVAETAVNHYEYMVDAKAFAGNKPIIWAEYQQTHAGAGTTTEARRFALAGSFAPAAGYGNGGPDGLRAFMESLPDGMVSSRVGNIITLTGGGVTAEADLDAITWQLVTPQTWGFVDFRVDNNATGNRHYTIPHGAELDCFASTGWAWGCFLRLGQNAGTATQTILASGVALANPSFIFGILEAGTASPNEFEAFLSDATADFALSEAGASVVLNQTLLAVVQYNPSNGNAEMWVKGPSGTATMIASATGPDGNIIAPDVWYWGRRTAGDNTRYWKEEMGGLFKAGRALTAGDINNIYTQGPQAVLGADLDGFWAFLNGEQEVEPDLVAANDATRGGTWSVAPPSGDALTVPSLVEWLVNDDTTPPGGATTVTTAAGLTSALSGAGSGDTIVANPSGGNGTIAFWDLPSGLTIPSGVTIMAALNKGIVVDCGFLYRGARTPNSGFWTQSGLSQADIDKDIWRSASTFAGGAQPLIGYWVEFGQPHYIISVTSMAQLRATYGNGNSPDTYFGPSAYQDTDGRVYVRWQKPHPAKYSRNNVWPERLWPGFPAAVTGGQLSYPVSANPNTYEITLSRRSNPGNTVVFRGSNITVGAGINSCGFRRFASAGAANLTVRRGTHFIWQNFCSGGGSTQWDVQRARIHDGMKMHLSRAEFKFGGPLEGIRSSFIGQAFNATHIYFLNCTIGGYHELIVVGGNPAPNLGGKFRFRNCTMSNWLNEGIQGNVGLTRVEIGYCFFWQAGHLGPGANGEEPNDTSPGGWFIHHSIFDTRVPTCANWGNTPPNMCMWAHHSPNSNQPKKFYNCTLIHGPDTEDRTGFGLQHLNRENVTLTGTAVAHEIFNNIVIRHGDDRYETDSSGVFPGPSDFAGGRQKVNADLSNEFWDFNLYFKDVPGTDTGIFFDEVAEGNGVANQNFSSLAAFKGSSKFTLSKTAGDRRGAYTPGFENSSTSVRPVLPTIDDFPTSRFLYRPSPTAAVTLAKNGTSLSGANWWSPVPSWGAQFFSWSAGGGTLQPSNYKGALDPNGSTLNVGVLNP